MIDDPLEQLLRNAGFSEGWAMSDGKLVIWEHEQEPPEPLERP